MSAGDVIALLSLVFALLTYVYSIALWPRLRMLIDEDVWLSYFIDRHGEHLCLKSYFTFFNSGAQPGAIANVLGTLSLVDGSGKAMSWDLRWNWFFEEDGVEANVGAHTFVVAGRGSGGTKLIHMNLLTDHPCTIVPGKYVLELRGLVGPGLSRWTRMRAQFEIVEKEANRLNDGTHRASEEQDAKHSFLLTRRDTFVPGMLHALHQRLRPGTPTFYHPGKELGES
jgi:hypothetical protein